MQLSLQFLLLQIVGEWRSQNVNRCTLKLLCKSSGYVVGKHSMDDKNQVIFIAPVKVEAELDEGNISNYFWFYHMWNLLKIDAITSYVRTYMYLDKEL